MGVRRNLSNQTPLFRLSAQSGLMTGIAAGTGTAGHLFAWRWTDATKICILRTLRIRLQVVTAFTAAQEVSLRLFRLTGYSASHTGGTQITVFPKKETRLPASLVNDARIATASALTAGTHTLDGQEFGGLAAWSQGGAAPLVNVSEAILIGDDLSENLVAFGVNEGFIIRNEIVYGAAGVARLQVDVDWCEAT